MNIYNDFIEKYNKLNNDDKNFVVSQMNNFITNIKKEKLDYTIIKFIIEQKQYFIENFNDNEYFKLNKIDKQSVLKLKLNIIKEFEDFIKYEYKTNDYGFNGKMNIKFNIIYKNFSFNFEYIGYADCKGKIESKFKFNELELSKSTCEIIENLFYYDLHPITLTCIDWYYEYKNIEKLLE